MCAICAILPLLGSTDPVPKGLNAGGTVMMVASITLVTALLGFCMYRLFRNDHPTK